MDNQVTDYASEIDIPELLAQSGLISSHDLSEAIQVSKRLQTPVSRVLMTSNCIDESLLDMSNHLQVLVAEELLSREEAYSCLRRLAGREIYADDLLDEIYSSPRFAQKTKLMADLVRKSGIVPQSQLDRVLQGSAKAGYSLKNALISEGILSAAFFPAILRLQERLRQGRLSIEQAAEQLKTEHAFWLKAEESQRFAALQSDALSEQVAKTRIQITHPKGAAHQSYSSLKSLPHAEGQNPGTPTLTYLLEGAGFVRKRDLQTVYDKLLGDPLLSAYVFENLGLLKPEELATVLECHALIAKGQLGSEQAIQALKISRSKKIRLKRALEELTGWSGVQARAERRNGMLAGFAVGCAAALLSVALTEVTKKFFARFAKPEQPIAVLDDEIP
ncbi:MAG: hypothetical protein C5B53_10695 [Candidatus Melainabacteria bacterium]|nr:MAG: hypothetical protein C5B53_10695 [Candidatus Melainabacteria bacterium]